MDYINKKMRYNWGSYMRACSYKAKAKGRRKCTRYYRDNFSSKTYCHYLFMFVITPIQYLFSLPLNIFPHNLSLLPILPSYPSFRLNISSSYNLHPFLLRTWVCWRVEWTCSTVCLKTSTPCTEPWPSSTQPRSSAENTPAGFLPSRTRTTRGRMSSFTVCAGNNLTFNNKW